MAKNKYIRESDVIRIVALVRGWDGKKIEWRDVCLACENILGYVPSRQGLYAHTQISEAFRARKKRLDPPHCSTSKGPSSLAIASQRLSYLNAIIQTQNLEIDNLRELVAIWQYNAYKRGITAAQLNEPLPNIDRERNTS